MASIGVLTVESAQDDRARAVARQGRIDSIEPPQPGRASSPRRRAVGARRARGASELAAFAGAGQRGATPQPGNTAITSAGTRQTSAAIVIHRLGVAGSARSSAALMNITWMIRR